MKNRIPLGICALVLCTGVSMAQNIHVDTVYFDTDRGSLNRATLNALDKAAAITSDAREYIVHLKVYADSAGNLTYKKRLAARRVLTARSYLEARGLDPAHITWKFYNTADLEKGGLNMRRDDRMDVCVLLFVTPGATDTLAGLVRPQ